MVDKQQDKTLNTLIKVMVVLSLISVILSVFLVVTGKTHRNEQCQRSDALFAVPTDPKPALVCRPGECEPGCWAKRQAELDRKNPGPDGKMMYALSCDACFFCYTVDGYDPRAKPGTVLRTTDD